METNNHPPDTKGGRVITLQLSRGVVALVGVLIAVIGGLLITVAFMAGAANQPPASSNATPAVVTVIAVMPTQAATLPVPSAVPAAAPAAYPAPIAAPAAQEVAAVSTQLLPTFNPIRPTAASETFAQPVDSIPTLPPPPPPDDVFRLETTPIQPAATLSAQNIEPTEAPPLPSATPVPQAEKQSAGAPPADAGGAQPPQRTTGGGASGEELKGALRWTAAQSPYTINRDVVLSAGASLVIEAGVEVRIARGASLFVEGSLYGLGTPGRPVRFVQLPGDERQRWEGIFGSPGSSIAFEQTEFSGGGAGGTVLAVEGGRMVIRNSRINGNGGQIRAFDSYVEIRDSEFANNDLPYGAAVDVTLTNGGTVILTNNRIINNRFSAGTAPVKITSQSFSTPTTLEIRSNLLLGQDGPNLQLFTNAQMEGNITCNTLIGGANGLSLRSEGPPNLSPMLNIRDNSIEGHTPPIIDIYLEFGIGRGATSDLPLGMANNWWELPNGPYEPDRNLNGRGEAVGENVTFEPWLTERPACAPRL